MNNKKFIMKLYESIIIFDYYFLLLWKCNLHIVENCQGDINHSNY